MTKHTPPPWKMGKQGMGMRVFSTSGKTLGMVFCQTQFGDRREDSRRAIPIDEATANARLIAAAPRLFAIAQQLVQHIDSFGGTFFPREINATINALRAEVAMIERAEGS